jgi:hypothetical protein
MLIFVHTPKCGGTTIQWALKRTYGNSILDDCDFPGDPNAKMFTNPELVLRNAKLTDLSSTSVIMGHLWAKKWSWVEGARFFTLLRHPIGRILSHYYYWWNKPFEKKHLNHSIRRVFIEEKPTLLEFAQYDPVKYFYTKGIFHDVDMRMFEFICDSKDISAREEDIKRFFRITCPLESRNMTKAYFPEYEEMRNDALSNPDLMNQLGLILAEDISFYKSHVCNSELS